MQRSYMCAVQSVSIGEQALTRPRKEAIFTNMNQAQTIAAASSLPQVSHELVQAVAVLEAQGVSDSRISAVVGGLEMLAAVRASEAYAGEISRLSADIISGEISTDSQWDKLERDTLNGLAQQVAQYGANLDTGILLNVAKQANAARRRHGQTAREALVAPSTQTNVVINIPVALLTRIQTVSAQPSALDPRVINGEVLDVSAETTNSITSNQLSQPNRSNGQPNGPSRSVPRPVTASDVSAVLGIDVNQKPKARADARMQELQDNHLLANIDQFISQVAG